MTKLYACPTCKEEMERAKFVKNICPECGQPVKFHRNRVDNRFVYTCVRADVEKKDEKKITVLSTAPEEDIAVGTGVLISGKDDNPEIWLLEEGEEDDAGEKPPKYRVIYRNMISAGRIYCPHCDTYLFTNLCVNNGGQADAHVCKSCRATVEYVFHSPGVLRYR